jgi:hypothetical protein
MAQNFPWKVDIQMAKKFHAFMECEVPQHSQQKAESGPYLSQINVIHTITPYSSKMYFNIIPPFPFQFYCYTYKIKINDFLEHKICV